MLDSLSPDSELESPLESVIAEELSHLAQFLPEIRIAALYGGQPIEKQIRRLREGAQILVATPGRMQDHMDHRTADVRQVSIVVLDEADEMLDMGFYRDVMKIVDHLPARKHLHMFSATISREVMDISWKYQKDPLEITVDPVEESAPKIDQYSLLTTGRNKLADMTEIMVRGGYHRAMVFCNTKYATEALCNQLLRLNFKAECLNGDMPQGERNKIMGRFRSGEIDVLVATDVAARGIDVSDVQVVFNYDLPQTNEYYLHRIGRTGRAKKEGVSFLLYTAEDKKRVREMIRYTQSEVTEVRLQFGKLVEVPRGDGVVENGDARVERVVRVEVVVPQKDGDSVQRLGGEGIEHGAQHELVPKVFRPVPSGNEDSARALSLGGVLEVGVAELGGEAVKHAPKLAVFRLERVDLAAKLLVAA